MLKCILDFRLVDTLGFIITILIITYEMTMYSVIGLSDTHAMRLIMRKQIPSTPVIAAFSSLFWVYFQREKGSSTCLAPAAWRQLPQEDLNESMVKYKSKAKSLNLDFFIA